MFFQDPIPNTFGYMVAGYLIFFLVSALYIISMFVRTRSLQRDLETLEELDTKK